MTTPRVLIVVPGTWWRDQPVWRMAYDLDRKPMQSLQSAFGMEPKVFEWPGGNTRRYRKQAAKTLADQLREHCRNTEINLVGFSHGGNVAAMATQLACLEIGRLITISTPVLKRYQPGPNVKTHIHLYNANDATQTRGGELLRIPYLGTIGRAARTFARAINIAIEIAIKSGEGAHGDILWKDETWNALNLELRQTRQYAECPLQEKRAE